MGFKLKGKYGAKKTTVDGITFDSKSEANYYIQACVLQKAGHLKILELQPKVYLTKAKILMKPDFLIEIDGMKIYVDVKGKPTPGFQLKARLWKHYGPGTLWVVNSNNFNRKKEIHSLKGD